MSNPPDTSIAEAPRRSSLLNAKIELVRPNMQAGSRRLYGHQRFKDLFPAFLCTVHTTIRASVPLLELGERRCREMGEDPVCAELADYYAEHAAEEQQHDAWLLEDIVSLGVPASQVLDQVPCPQAAAMVGSQYYWIEHFHPIALLGYLAILERPFDPNFYRGLIDKWGIPESGFRTLILHAELDDGHRSDLDDLIDRLPLSLSQERMLGSSALATAGYIADLFNYVVDRFERNSDQTDHR